MYMTTRTVVQFTCSFKKLIEFSILAAEGGSINGNLITRQEYYHNNQEKSTVEPLYYGQRPKCPD